MGTSNNLAWVVHQSNQNFSIPHHHLLLFQGPKSLTATNTSLEEVEEFKGREIIIS